MAAIDAAVAEKRALRQEREEEKYEVKQAKRRKKGYLDPQVVEAILSKLD